MKLENEGVPAMKLMKLRLATGLGLVIFMATMIGVPVRVTHAQDDEGGVTLASLAGKFAGRSNGFVTICLSAGVPISCSSVSPVPTAVAFNVTEIEQITSDAAGNSCAVSTSTAAPVSGTTFPALVNTPVTTVRTNTSFDPTTGSGTESASQYFGGHCNGAVFDMTGATKVATFTDSFDVSDSGNRIEVIVDTFNAVGGIIEGLVDSGTFIRQHPQN